MSATIKSRQVVKPAKPTWNGIMSLTQLDQAGFTAHTPIIYIYHKPIQTSLHSSYGRDEILETIRDSLSRILVPYYPLAGRLRWVGNGGRAELDCNAMGAVLIEAESHKKISDFGDFSSPYQMISQGLVPQVDYELPLQEVPILLVQLTWFKCGGICFGTEISHMIADGQTHFYFLQEWANLARGISKPDIHISPYLERRHLQDDGANNQGIGPYTDVDSFARLPTLIGAGNDLEERQKEVISETLILSRTQIDSLMKKAAENEANRGHPWSRYEVITAHIWRSACKARGHTRHQCTALCFLIDSRRCLNPPLPSSYVGDAVVIGVVTGLAGELTSAPLGNVCRRIREKKKETMNDHFVRSTIKFLKAQNTLFKYQERAAFGGPQGVFFGNPNVQVSSLLNFPVRSLDFGWGKEIYMGTATQQFDGDIVIFPGFDNDGSVVISAGLQAEHMEKFREYLYMDIYEDQDTSSSTRKSRQLLSRY